MAQPELQSCPDEDTLLEYLNRAISSERREALQAHVSRCDDCQALLGQMAALESGVATATVPKDAPPRGPAGTGELTRGAVVGRYVVVDVLGEGGMGRVFAAYDPDLNRKVAVKLLHERVSRPDAIEEQRNRLLREAQAMALLTHPNVSAVFDVGPFRDGVFVAMELVDGQDLRKWRAERPRSWREVLAVMMEAGRGLAAAHAAGLVHRDVKPDNILVGKDGRVRVSDFGLAAVSGAVELAPPAPRDMGTNPSLARPLATPLTEPGTVMGTPSYMAPEQSQGHPADARSDQFSFCVTLYEGLYDERPFTSAQREEWTRGVDVQPREAPKGSAVPGWLRAVVLRGLSHAPEARYPSMDALLRELGRDPRIQRRRWAAALAAAALAVVGVIGYREMAESQAQACRAGEQKLVGIWDAEVKRTVRAAFEATGKSDAPDTWRVVEQKLDQYTAGWLEMDVAACEASSKGVDASELPLLTRVCLGHRLVEVRALKDALVRADEKTVTQARQAVGGLTPLAGCSDAGALRSPVKPPADEAQRAKVEELRTRLVEARTLRDTGKPLEALAAMGPLVEAVRALHYQPLEAQALAQFGTLQAAMARTQEAVATLQEAELAAVAVGDEQTAIDVSVSLIRTHYLLGAYDQSHVWKRRAEAYIARLGGSESAEASVLAAMSRVVAAEGHLAEAETLAKRAHATFERLYGPEHVMTAKVLHDLAFVLQQGARFDEVLDLSRRVSAMFEKIAGPEHPLTVAALSLQGSALIMQGKLAEARPLMERSLALQERDLGPEHFRVADTCLGLAQIYGSEESTLAEAARLYRRARENFAKALGPANPNVGRAWVGEADVLRRQGRYQDAIAALEQARAIATRLPEGPLDDVASVSHNLGNVYLDLRRYREARAEYQRAAELREKAFGQDNALVGMPLSGLGRAELELGQYDQAIAPLRRALQLAEGKLFHPEWLADTRFALARALWESRTDREQAVHLAREAADAYASMTHVEEKRREVTAWLSRHVNG